MGGDNSQALYADFVQGNSPTPAPPKKLGIDTGAFRSWGESDGVFFGTASTHTQLPGGIYRMMNTPDRGPAFVKQRNDTDTLIDLPDTESDAVIAEVREFANRRSRFKEHGFLYKRGIMLYGPPGSGKTCTLQMVLKMLVGAQDGIAVLVEHPHVAATCLQTLRRIEPERQIVAIYEDLDALVDQFGESSFLALLDGESQVDNIVNLATTNYPEKLTARFLDRPSRFDTVRYIGMPSPEARAFFLHARAPSLTAEKVAEYVRLSDGLSFAHLREMLVLTICFDQSIESAAFRVREPSINPPHSQHRPEKQGFGFSAEAPKFTKARYLNFDIK